MEYSVEDEWRIKNQHCTAGEIDDRQALELFVILDKWLANALPPWEVLLQTGHVVGVAYSDALAPYVSYYDCSTAEGARAHVLKAIGRYKNVSDFSLKERQEIADMTWSMQQKHRESINQVRDSFRLEIFDEGQQPVIQENILAIRSRLESGEFDSWQTAHAMAAVLLPAPPVTSAQIEPTLPDDLEREIYSREPEEHKRDKQFDNFRDFIQRIGRSRKEVEGTKKNPSEIINAFTPETEEEIKRPLAILFSKQRAYAAAYKAWVKEKEAAYEATHGISLEQLRAEQKAAKDAAEQTFMEGYAEWAAAETAKGMVLNEFSEFFFKFGFKYNEPFNKHLSEIKSQTKGDRFRWHYTDDFEPDENVALLAPIDFPDRKLCNQIEIAPSGTGLIQLRDKDPYHSWEPTSIGRITTYSVSFIPKNPADLDLLKQTLKAAMLVLGNVPHKYVSIDESDHTDHFAGKPYARDFGDKELWSHDFEELNVSAYIETKNGKVSLHNRLDLDDLWTLYYILEPIIEPSAQIATAMNAARYAEERGAVLTPPDNFWENGYQYEVAEQSGYLQKSNPESMLAEAMRDSLADFALNKIEETELAVRISTLAHHTLTGDIVDAVGSFPTFDTMLIDARRNGSTELTYGVALHERVQGLLRCLLNEPKDSKRPLYVALMATAHEIAGTLKEQSRDQARHRQKASYAYFNKRLNEAVHGRDKLTHLFDEKDFSMRRSDAVAGRLDMTDDERDEKRKTALTNASSQLVIANSAVETAIDGVHEAHVTWAWHGFRHLEKSERGWDAGSCLGTYITRTKGSPHVRYELPSALKPFCPQENHRPFIEGFVRCAGSIIKS